jgi:hypothetical protein
MADYKSKAQREFEKKMSSGIKRRLAQPFVDIYSGAKEMLSTQDVWGEGGNSRWNESQRLALKEAKEAAIEKYPDESSIKERESFVRDYIKKTFGKENWAQPIKNAIIPAWGYSNEVKETTSSPSENFVLPNSIDQYTPSGIVRGAIEEYTPVGQAKMLREIAADTKKGREQEAKTAESLGVTEAGLGELTQGINKLSAGISSNKTALQQAKDQAAMFSSLINNTNVRHDWEPDVKRNYVIRPSVDLPEFNPSVNLPELESPANPVSQVPFEQRQKEAGSLGKKQAADTLAKIDKDVEERVRQKIKQEEIDRIALQQDNEKKQALEQAFPSKTPYANLLQEAPEQPRLSYAEEYAKRYQQAMAGRGGYTSSSTGGSYL